MYVYIRVCPGMYEFSASFLTVVSISGSSAKTQPQLVTCLNLSDSQKLLIYFGTYFCFCYNFFLKVSF